MSIIVNTLHFIPIVNTETSRHKSAISGPEKSLAM